jgi:two-component system, OmpR family, sensor kinase
MTRPPRQPLRVRLVLLVVALTAAGLAIAGVASTALLRTYLTDRVDEQLLESARPVANVPHLEPGGGTSPPGAPRGPLPGQFYAVLVDAAGTTTQVISTPRDTAAGLPVLPVLTIDQAKATAGVVTTVPSEAGGPAWRALVVPLADGSGSVTVAASLAEVDATVTRLLVLQVVLGVTVLLVVAGSGWLLVRRSLRPLVEVEQVAGQIAAGDLSRRVPGADDRTEVGQLAGAFNTMVDRIQDSFEAQAASEAAARESEARMRRFIADASHELRTPLTSVRGFAELYRQGAVEGPEQVAHVMGRIEDQAQRMGLLVDDLLLLARLDRQRPLASTPVDLVTVAADVVHDAQLTAPDRSLGLHVVEGDRPPVVLGDADRLRQVVTNLVGNALRHTPADARVDVTVRVASDPVADADADPGGAARVVLEVRDTGPGLPPDAADRVFERFYRADAARSRDDGGTGLGLAIVAALVRAHGGRVEVDSVAGVGATFRVVLPAVPLEQHAAP